MSCAKAIFYVQRTRIWRTQIGLSRSSPNGSSPTLEQEAMTEADTVAEDAENTNSKLMILKNKKLLARVVFCFALWKKKVSVVVVVIRTNSWKKIGQKTWQEMFPYPSVLCSRVKQLLAFGYKSSRHSLVHSVEEKIYIKEDRLRICGPLQAGRWSPLFFFVLETLVSPWSLPGHRGSAVHDGGGAPCTRHRPGRDSGSPSPLRERYCRLRQCWASRATSSSKTFFWVDSSFFVSSRSRQNFQHVRRIVRANRPSLDRLSMIFFSWPLSSSPMRPDQRPAFWDLQGEFATNRRDLFPTHLLGIKVQKRGLI